MKLAERLNIINIEHYKILNLLHCAQRYWFYILIQYIYKKWSGMKWDKHRCKRVLFFQHCMNALSKMYVLKTCIKFSNSKTLVFRTRLMYLCHFYLCKAWHGIQNYRQQFPKQYHLAYINTFYVRYWKIPSNLLHTFRRWNKFSLVIKKWND